MWCALIDQDTPFEIRTNPRNRQLFDPQGSYVVAYGSLQYGENIGEYIPFDIELDYRSTSRVPKYLLITASASKYHDFLGLRSFVFEPEDGFPRKSADPVDAAPATV